MRCLKTVGLRITVGLIYCFNYIIMTSLMSYLIVTDFAEFLLLLFSHLGWKKKHLMDGFPLI